MDDATGIVCDCGVLCYVIAASVARGGDGRGTEADRLLRLQRADIERRSRNQEKTDEINRVGLRRRNRPPRKTPDDSRRSGFLFHGVLLLEMARNWKGQIRRRSAHFAVTAPPVPAAAGTAPAGLTG